MHWIENAARGTQPTGQIPWSFKATLNAFQANAVCVAGLLPTHLFSRLKIDPYAHKETSGSLTPPTFKSFHVAYKA
jgi:hypothetical protein